MSKSVKFTNNTYLHSNSVIHNRIDLETFLNRFPNLYCKKVSTGSNPYVDVDLGYDKNNPVDRRVYFYMAITNSLTLKAGIFGYNNGVLTGHKSLTESAATISSNEDKTFRINVGSAWSNIVLISSYSIRN